MALFMKSVTGELLDCLNRMMSDPALEAFYLVGGTALALRFGHRRSIDIGLFTSREFDVSEWSGYMSVHHGLVNIETAPHTVRGSVDGVKVDMIAHLYPLLAPLDFLEGIRMASLQDIAAMKLNAISNRGSKKDFWDYALLLDHFKHREMLGYFSRKYAACNLWHVEKSVHYFEDADKEPDPMDLKGQTWEAVKSRIVECCR